jgi:L-threonylcarbamoyladenylate synthase
MSNEAEIQHFARILRGGGVVAFPTETVYGLGADATNSDAVLRIYEIKGRPRFNPLIVHCADRAMAETIVDISPLAERLADAYWPGPLTLVLPKKPGATVSDIVTAGLATVGVRVPAHPLAQDLIRAVGRPLAAPSANPSGKLSPTRADQIVLDVPILDGGPCRSGVESTILKVDGDRVTQLRAGAVAREELESLLERSIPTAAPDSKIAAPGMLTSHYAPNARLRLDAAEPTADEAYLAFGPTAAAGLVRNLSRNSDLHEAARNLFAMLHELDALAPAIAVAPIPTTGLGEAINDRLKRAATR